MTIPIPNDMIERAAKALCCPKGCRPYSEQQSAGVGCAWLVYEKQARTVIEAALKGE